MNLLLDTHVLIWFLEGDSKLPDEIKSIIEDEANNRFLSIASVWEITIKASIGKLEFSKSANEIKNRIDDNDISLIDITINHLDILRNLPHHHRDPFDRLLIAQAISENFSIISADQHFTPYEAEIIWQ